MVTQQTPSVGSNDASTMIPTKLTTTRTTMSLLMTPVANYSMSTSLNTESSKIFKCLPMSQRPEFASLDSSSIHRRVLFDKVLLV
jgi:hypothetical protein